MIWPRIADCFLTTPSVTDDLSAFATTSAGPTEPVPVRFDAILDKERTECRIAPNSGGIGRKQHFEVVAGVVRQCREPAQRTRWGLEQDHQSEVDAHRDVTGGQSSIKHLECRRPI